MNDLLLTLAIIWMDQSALCIPVSLPGGSTFSNLYLTHTFYCVKMVLCYCFPANLLNLTCVYAFRGRSPRQLLRPQKKAMYRDSKAIELETAKEILAEVFRVRLSDVDEMILSRFEAAGNEDIDREELWPEEFSLE